MLIFSSSDHWKPDLKQESSDSDSHNQDMYIWPLIFLDAEENCSQHFAERATDTRQLCLCQAKY